LIEEKSGKTSKLKIFRTTIVDVGANAGEIIGLDERGLIVAARDCALVLEEVQLEGKRRMTGSDFVRGHRWMTNVKGTSVSQTQRESH
jgi:methionyl-tRNA formyltransferase